MLRNLNRSLNHGRLERGFVPGTPDCVVFAYHRSPLLCRARASDVRRPPSFMTSDETDTDSGTDFDLAPPPSFGIAARTDKHLLPVATAMGDILGDEGEDIDEPRASSSSEEDQARDWAVPFPTMVSESDEPDSEDGVAVEADAAVVDASQPVVAVPAVAPRPAPPVAATREEASGGSGKFIVPVLLIAVAVGVFIWWSGKDSTPAVAPAQAAAEVPAKPADKEPAVPPPTEPPKEDKVASANDIGRMKTTSLTERHALLGEIEAAGQTARVNLDLHIALDLMQAEQAAAPCEMFSDTLTLIESSRDRSAVLPAIASVDTAPQPGAGESRKACEGLQARLDALKAEMPAETPAVVPTAEAGTPSPSSARPGKKKKKKSKPRPSTADAGPPPTPTPPVAEPPPAEKPKPPRKPTAGSVATRLEDDLRGLK